MSEPLRMPADEFKAVKAAKSATERMGVKEATEWSDAMIEEFRRLYAESMQAAPRWPTPDELRSFLSEHVTVVKPGETLVIQASYLTPAQMREVQDALNWVYPDGERALPFKTIVVPGDGLGVVQADGVTHACPEPSGGLMPCCGRTPFEAPRTDRITLDPDLVTCGKADGQ